MELAPHDLLRLRSTKALIYEGTGPAWVTGALARAPLVVVRRAPLVGDLVPVGVRGQNRSERFAAYLPLSAIAERITPEQLTTMSAWRGHQRANEIEALHALDRVAALLNTIGLAWGPVGSIGFELASGIPTATPTSDLDLLLRSPSVLPLNVARNMHSALTAITARLDVQIEVPAGAIALSEYIRGESTMLLRTRKGPRLVSNPWVESSLLGGTAE
jgi:phosphoribosyl-dephospho-CoA transferase